MRTICRTLCTVGLMLGVLVSPGFTQAIPTSGLRLWLEANLGVTANGSGSVSAWQDQSGNGNNATQSNSSYRPVVVANVLNGLPVIQFTASTNQWLTLPNLMSGATAGEVFIVVKATSALPSGGRGLWYMGSQAGDYYPFTDGNVYESFGSTVRYNIGRPASGVAQYSLYDVSAQAGQWTARVDGVTLLSTATNTVSFTASPTLGRDGAGYAFDGGIAEIIIYNTVLTAAQRTTVGQYLQSKYNLPGIVMPANPSNLIVNPISATEASLVWSDTYTNTGITYTIWRKTGAGGYVAVAQVNNALSYVDSGLTAGTTYSYEVSSSTLAGSSPGFSNAVSVATLASGTDMPLSGMKLWLIADSGVQATSGGSVSIWQDECGGGNNATQLTTASEPTVVANALNGRPVVQFTASTNQWLTLPNLMSGATAGEVFVVVKATSATPSGGRGLWYVGSQAGDYYPFTDGNVYESFGSTVRYNIGRPASGVAQYSLYDVSAQAGQWTARVDGVTLLSSATNTVSFTASPTLGRDGAGYAFDGGIAEIIVYNSVLTAAQRTTVGQYLQSKYNLPGIAVPANPSNLIATPISATETSLRWSDTYSNTGITYTIWRQTGAGGYVAVAQVNNALSYVDSGLTAGTNYSYEISSNNLAGSSPGYSNVVSITTLASGTDMPLSGMKLWLIADSGVQATSGGSVINWQDESGGGNTATQLTAASEPTVVANALNGRPVVQFTASTNQWLTLPNLMSGATAGEVFVVVKATSATPSAGRGFWSLGTQAAEYYPSTDKNVYECFGSTVQYNVGRPASGVAQYSLYDVSAQAGQWTARVDGVTLLSSATNTVSFGGASPTLGRNGAGNTFDGGIAEIIIYNSVLTAAQRTTVGQYLQSKYNLPGIAVPANPSNLIATPISATETSLVWSDAYSNTGITYTIWRQTGAGGYVAVAQVNNALSYVDSGLTAGTNYSYEISSNNLAGSSPGYSNVVGITTLASGTDMPLSGMKLWLIADSGVQAGANGSVIQWADQSGNGNNALQLTASSEPTVVANALNGRPVTQFTASSSQWFSLPASLMSGATAGEVFVVVNASSTMPSTARGLWHLGASGGYYPHSDGNIYECFGSSSQIKVGVPATNVTNYNVYDVYAQANQWAAAIDGVTLNSNTTNQVLFNSSPQLGTNGSCVFDGEIAEIIIYSSVLTSTQRATVDQYLQVKYGLVFGAGTGNTDGIPNSWLLQYFGTTNVNPNLDYDGNGQTVAQDYSAGVDPVDFYNNRPFVVLPSALGNTYTYDLSGRLATASYSNGVNVRFTSDAASNLASVANYGSIVQWRVANNLPPDGTGIGTDTVILANDGIPNLVKYAFGLAAYTPAPANDPVVTVSNINGGFLTLTYTRPDPAPSDIVYTVRVSPDGTNWSSGSGATVNVSTSVSNGIATVVVRDNVPVYAPNIGRRIQLVIQRVPHP